MPISPGFTDSASLMRCSHRALLGGYALGIETLVGNQAAKQFNQPFPVFFIGNESRKGLQCLLGLIAHNDLLFAPDPSHLVARQVREQVPVLGNQLLL